MNMAANNKGIKSRFEVLKDNIVEVLSQLFNQKFTVKQTIKKDVTPEEYFKTEEFPKVFLSISTQGVYKARHVFSLPQELILQLYAWMLSADPDSEIQDEHIEGIQEAVDQILGQIRILVDGEEVKISLSEPELHLLDSANDKLPDLKDQPGSSITYMLAAGKNAYEIRHYLLTDFEETVAELDETQDEQSQIDEQLGIEEDLDDVDVQSAEFGEFKNGLANGGGSSRNIDMLLGVQLEVLVELGRKSMLVKDVLKLGKGSVLELSKSAGEPLDILVNGRKLAEGEVVVVDDSFGVRITSLASETERIKSLG